MSQKSDGPKKHTPGAEYFTKAKQITTTMNDTVRAYIILAIGLFLFLFSIGYFDFLRIGIGLLGAIMVTWGTIRSGIVTTITDWFDALLKQS